MGPVGRGGLHRRHFTASETHSGCIDRQPFGRSLTRTLPFDSEFGPFFGEVCRKRLLDRALLSRVGEIGRASRNPEVRETAEELRSPIKRPPFRIFSGLPFLRKCAVAGYNGGNGPGDRFETRPQPYWRTESCVKTRGLGRAGMNLRNWAAVCHIILQGHAVA